MNRRMNRRINGMELTAHRRTMLRHIAKPRSNIGRNPLTQTLVDMGLVNIRRGVCELTPHGREVHDDLR